MMFSTPFSDATCSNVRVSATDLADPVRHLKSLTPRFFESNSLSNSHSLTFFSNTGSSSPGSLPFQVGGLGSRPWYAGTSPWAIARLRYHCGTESPHSGNGPFSNGIAGPSAGKRHLCQKATTAEACLIMLCHMTTCFDQVLYIGCMFHTGLYNSGYFCMAIPTW